MSNIIVTESVKRCTKCGESKPVTEFYKARGNKDGACNQCKACKDALQKAWKKANPERIRAYSKAWVKANPMKVRVMQKAWREANPEKARAIDKAWREANPEKARVMQKAWREANPGKVRAQTHRRRSRKLNAPGSHTAQQVIDLLQKQHGKCPYCKTGIIKKYHIDHIVALANGGSNDIKNIQLLCQRCNCSKNDSDPIMFAQRQGLLL